MAAQITHIVLTNKIFDKFFQDKIKKDFFVGTSFPDIRYLGVIDRDKTHYQNLTIKDLEKDDSFLAGLKFHSILDTAREEFIVKNNIYDLCPKSQYITQSIKLLEDEILYDYIENWEEYIKYFDEILAEEKKFSISDKNLEKWHDILKQYFQEKPSQEKTKKLLLNIGFKDEAANEINENISQIKNNDKIIDIIKNLYNNFNSIIES